MRFFLHENIMWKLVLHIAMGLLLLLTLGFQTSVVSFKRFGGEVSHIVFEDTVTDRVWTDLFRLC